MKGFYASKIYQEQMKRYIKYMKTLQIINIIHMTISIFLISFYADRINLPGMVITLFNKKKPVGSTEDIMFNYSSLRLRNQKKYS